MYKNNKRQQIKFIFSVLIGILLFCSSGYCQTVDESLVGWWKFDEAYGSTVLDSSGNGYDGSIVGATRVSGKIDGALDFDGDLDYVNIPSAAFSTLDDQVTISFWAFGGNSLPKNTVLFQGNNSAGDRVLNCHLPYVNSGVANIQFDAGQDGGYDHLKQNAEADEYKGQWNHWALTKDALSGEMKMYLNGQLWYSESGQTRHMTGVAIFRIGGRLSDGTVNYEGMVDDFRVYDRTLSENEIKRMLGLEVQCQPEGGDLTGDCLVDYNDVKELLKYWLLCDGTVKSMLPDSSHLQAFYMFDENSGTVAYDSSGKNRDAVIEANDINKAWAPGWQGGSALYLDGYCRVAIPAEVFDGITDEFTISAWINTGEAKVSSIDFKAGLTDLAIFDEVSWMFNGSDDPNGWVNLAFVKNAGDSIMRIYRNGVILAHDGNALMSINGSEAGVTDLGSMSGELNCFKGFVDNLQIYDYALSQSEIVYLAAVSQIWQPISPYLVPYDPHEDGVINFLDFSIIGKQWLQDLALPH